MKLLKIILLIVTSCMIHSCAMRTVEGESCKYRLTYKDRQLHRVYSTRMKASFFKRLFQTKKSRVIWSEGKVEIIYTEGRRGYTNSNRTMFLYDSLYRVSEGMDFHEDDGYEYAIEVVYKYHDSDRTPYTCYYRDGGQRKEFYDECFRKIDYQEIIEHELTARSQYYARDTTFRLLGSLVFPLRSRENARKYVIWLYGLSEDEDAGKWLIGY